MINSTTNTIRFRPPWYLRNGHVQTILTGFYKPKAALSGTIEHVVPIEPFGNMLVHENVPPVETLVNPTEAVFLLHGLGSSHRGTYMTHMAAQCLGNGYRVFRFDLPGAGESFHHTVLPPHGACSDLVWDALVAISAKCGIVRWRGAGVSLGGNILLKMLANRFSELESLNPAMSIVKACAIAPPIDLGACCNHMETGLNRIYGRYFLRSLKRQSRLRAEIWEPWRERLQQASFSTIRRFDDSVTAPLAGFRSAEEYYRVGSSIEDLYRIRVPTTVLIDRHDPIVPCKIFREATWSNSVRTVTTHHGGHVGYLHRVKSKGLERWADAWLVDELLQGLENTQESPSGFQENCVGLLEADHSSAG